MKFAGSILTIGIGAAVLFGGNTAKAAEPTLLSILSAYGVTAGDQISATSLNLNVFTATKIASFAADEAVESVGLYDVSSNTYIPLFVGAEPTGVVKPELVPAGSYDLYDNNLLGHSTVHGGVGGLFYSDPALNPSNALNPTGEVHTQIYKKGGSYFIGFEDRTLVNTSKSGLTPSIGIDYNDYVIELTPQTSVPEPGTVALLVTGFSAAGGLLIRRRRQK